MAAAAGSNRIAVTAAGLLSLTLFIPRFFQCSSDLWLLAFDTIMTFEGRFSEQILPDQLHILNVSFLVPALRRDFGGCAGNIAYSLKLLGGRPLPMATLGSDGADYLERLKSQGISTEFVSQVQDTYTAQAMIMTDRDNNQITAFHPGALCRAHRTKIAARSDNPPGHHLALGRDAMLSTRCSSRPPESRSCSIRARACRCSMARSSRPSSSSQLGHRQRYDGQDARDRTGMSNADISRKVQGLVVDAGRRRLRGLGRRGEDRRAAGEGEGSRRSHRLRRCLARRAAVRLEQGWDCRSASPSATRSARSRSPAAGRRTTSWGR